MKAVERFFIFCYHFWHWFWYRLHYITGHERKKKVCIYFQINSVSVDVCSFFFVRIVGWKRVRHTKWAYIYIKLYTIGDSITWRYSCVCFGMKWMSLTHSSINCVTQWCFHYVCLLTEHQFRTEKTVYKVLHRTTNARKWQIQLKYDVSLP